METCKTSTSLIDSSIDTYNILNSLESNSAVYKEVMNIGKDVIESNRTEWSLKKSKVRDALSGSDGAKEITRSVINMKAQANKINKLADIGSLKKVFLSPSRIAAKVMIKYEDIEKVVQGISKSMSSAINMLEKDCLELMDVSSWLTDQIAKINVLSKVIEDLISKMKDNKVDMNIDDTEKDRLRLFLVTRQQDLVLISTAYGQFKATILQTVSNNKTEVQTANRMRIIVGTIAEVGLVARVSMNRQKKVNDLNQSAKTFAAGLIKQNAIALKDQTVAANKSYNDMSDIMLSIKESAGAIKETLAEESKASEEYLKKATKNIQDMELINDELEKELSKRERTTSKGIKLISEGHNGKKV